MEAHTPPYIEVQMFEIMVGLIIAYAVYRAIESFNGLIDEVTDEQV